MWPLADENNTEEKDDTAHEELHGRDLASEPQHGNQSLQRQYEGLDDDFAQGEGTR